MKIKKKPLVSVIVINYNNSKYIFKSLNSIINQDYQNLEIVFVDDQSTDDSLKVVRKQNFKTWWCKFWRTGIRRTFWWRYSSTRTLWCTIRSNWKKRFRSLFSIQWIYAKRYSKYKYFVRDFKCCWIWEIFINKCGYHNYHSKI